MKNLFSRYIVFFLSLLFSAGQFVNAQESSYTIPQVVSMALKENPLLISEGARVDEKRLAGSQSKSWSGPSLEVAAGQRKDESNSGPRFEAAFSQPLPLAGKPGLRGRLFDLESESWKTQLAASEAMITLNVVRLSVEYAINRRLANFVDKRQKRFSLVKSYMEGRVFASPQKKVESRIVQNRMNTLLSEALQSQANFRVSFENLRSYAPMESGIYPEITVPWFAGSKNLDAIEGMEKALKNNPDLRLRELSVKSVETEKALASKERWPDTKLIASYEQGKATEKETNTGLGIGVEFPYWNGNRAGFKSLEKKKIAELGLRDLEERRLRSDLPKALIEFDAARNAVKEYPQSLLAELETQLRESEEGFRKGQVDLLTFLELDDSSAETYRHILEAQMNYITKATELFRLTGERDILARLESL
jgi:cobalt-zinc-cadmium efflux system outer membrane protein